MRKEKIPGESSQPMRTPNRLTHKGGNKSQFETELRSDFNLEENTGEPFEGFGKVEGLDAGVRHHPEGEADFYNPDPFREATPDEIEDLREVLTPADFNKFLEQGITLADYNDVMAAEAAYEDARTERLAEGEGEAVMTKSEILQKRYKEWSAVAQEVNRIVMANHDAVKGNYAAGWVGRLDYVMRSMTQNAMAYLRQQEGRGPDDETMLVGVGAFVDYVRVFDRKLQGEIPFDAIQYVFEKVYLPLKQLEGRVGQVNLRREFFSPRHDFKRPENDGGREESVDKAGVILHMKNGARTVVMNEEARGGRSDVQAWLAAQKEKKHKKYLAKQSRREAA